MPRYVSNTSLVSTQDLDNFPREEIIDDDSARGAASVDQTLARGVGRREMAPDERL